MRNGQEAVDLAMTRLGKNNYTQTYLRSEFFNGYSDCSSMPWKCYEKAYGIYIGSWTGEQVSIGRLLFKRSKAVSYAKLTAEEMAQLQPGDLLFYGDDTADHVEMYIGNGQQIGHGYGVGPRISDTLSYAHSSGFYQARRYVDDDVKVSTNSSKQQETTTKPQHTTAKGASGIADRYDAGIAGQYTVAVDDFLNLRLSANTSSDCNIICKMYPGESVMCYGYYTTVDGIDWYYVVYNGIIGFCSSQYLERRLY